MTEDAKEGLKAFGEKRKPTWPGSDDQLLGSVYGQLCNAVNMPVICPTCQNVFRDHGIRASDPCYCAWGCFRYFAWSNSRTAGRLRPLSDRTLPRVKLAKGR